MTTSISTYGNTDRYRSASSPRTIGSICPPNSSSVSPIRTPPSTVPPMLPKPPSTAAAKPEEHVREADGEVEAAERTDQQPGETGQQRAEIPNDSIDSRFALTP